MRRALILTVCAAGLWTATPRAAAPHISGTVLLRGEPQQLHLAGTRGQRPVIVSSGDGGWVHLAPQVAAFLATNGYFVVGFDAKAYLEGFTARDGAVAPAVVPDDFATLVKFAAGTGGPRPVLVGVSEGAGLSVLAATSDQVKHAVSGIVALGLPDINELGWRWKDDVIYVTHGVPREPLFKVSAIAAQVAPLPLAAIHSTHDEFVPVGDVQRVLGLAGDPKRLWLIQSVDHRFSDRLDEVDRRVLDAISWIDSVS